MNSFGRSAHCCLSSLCGGMNGYVVELSSIISSTEYLQTLDIEPLLSIVQLFVDIHFVRVSMTDREETDRQVG